MCSVRGASCFPKETAFLSVLLPVIRKAPHILTSARHRWPHATFQKPNLIKMKMNTILLTAQNLITHQSVLQVQDDAVVTPQTSDEKA